MKTRNWLIILPMIFILFESSAQYCTPPKPMTQAQMQKTTGLWQGNYTFNGETRDMTIRISIVDDRLVCTVENPPLAGKETKELYFFCDGGEFHFRKFVSDWSYEFQAVPENNEMKGMLKIRRDNDKPEIGKFVLSRHV